MSHGSSLSREDALAQELLHEPGFAGALEHARGVCGTRAWSICFSTAYRSALDLQSKRRRKGGRNLAPQDAAVEYLERLVESTTALAGSSEKGAVLRGELDKLTRRCLEEPRRPFGEACAAPEIEGPSEEVEDIESDAGRFLDGDGWLSLPGRLDERLRTEGFVQLDGAVGEEDVAFMLSAVRGSVLEPLRLRGAAEIFKRGLEVAVESGEEAWLGRIEKALRERGVVKSPVAYEGNGSVPGCVWWDSRLLAGRDAVGTTPRSAHVPGQEQFFYGLCSLKDCRAGGLLLEVLPKSHTADSECRRLLSSDGGGAPRWTGCWGDHAPCVLSLLPGSVCLLSAGLIYRWRLSEGAGGAAVCVPFVFKDAE